MKSERVRVSKDLQSKTDLVRRNLIYVEEEKYGIDGQVLSVEDDD